jgi:hypothetical protein
MYPLFAETHTAAGTLRLERIDRPGDSRNELRIPPGHTVDGLPVRATLDGRVMWTAFFARGRNDGYANGVWLFPDRTDGVVASMGALYRLDAMDARSAVRIADDVDIVVVSADSQSGVFMRDYDSHSVEIFRLHGPSEDHEFQCAIAELAIRDGAVVGSCSAEDGYPQIPFRIDLAASADAPSFVRLLDVPS